MDGATLPPILIMLPLEKTIHHKASSDLCVIFCTVYTVTLTLTWPTGRNLDANIITLIVLIYIYTMITPTHVLIYARRFVKLSLSRSRTPLPPPPHAFLNKKAKVLDKNKML